MKTYITTAFAAILTLHVAATEATTVKPASSYQTIEHKKEVLNQQEADILVKRVYEIRSLDRNMLSATEKQDLRKELRTIQKQLNDPLAGGVYISAGALILILILLIILL
jgi:uncharacterized ion transporter superfamily protein YfcC